MTAELSRFLDVNRKHFGTTLVKIVETRLMISRLALETIKLLNDRP